MKKLVLALVAVFICTVLALVGCMYLNDHIKANAEEVERIDDFSVRELEQVDRSGDQLRSINATLPDDGVVGENLATNTNFSKGTAGFLFTGGMSGSIYSGFGYDCLEVSGSMTNQRFIYYLNDFVQASTTYTLSLYILNDSVSAPVYVWDSLNRQLCFNRIFTGPSQVVSCTFTVPETFGTIHWGFDGQADLHFYLFWFKLEIGSSFTGYVPNINEIESDSYHDGYDTGVTDVESYNKGLPTSVDENFNFTDPIFSDVALSSGDTMDLDPGFRYAGSGTFSYDHDFGMGFSNSSGVSSITQTVLEIPEVIQTASRYYIFAFYFTGSLYMSSSVELVLSLGGQSYSIIVQPRLQTAFVYYRVLASDLTSNIMTLTLSTPNSSVYLTRFKYQRSDYFTGFGDSTSNSVSYSNGFNDGYSDGLEQGKVLVRDEAYADGLAKGRVEGYDRGKEEGDEAGYWRGYGEGLDTAENGNWQSMLSALIGVPVSFIRGFFDFELFGFNFLSLFKSIIAISLIVFITKLVIFRLG